MIPKSREHQIAWILTDPKFWIDLANRIGPERYKTDLGFCWLEINRFVGVKHSYNLTFILSGLFSVHMRLADYSGFVRKMKKPKPDTYYELNLISGKIFYASKFVETSLHVGDELSVNDVEYYKMMLALMVGE